MGQRDKRARVSQDDSTRTSGSIDPSGQPDTTEPTPSGAETVENPGVENAPTIGTGTSIALGCIAGTVLLIAIGLIYILIVSLL
jgi:hypothetical protein